MSYTVIKITQHGVVIVKTVFKKYSETINGSSKSTQYIKIALKQYKAAGKLQSGGYPLYTSCHPLDKMLAWEQRHLEENLCSVMQHNLPPPGTF